jgi:hypothetical protein
MGKTLYREGKMNEQVIPDNDDEECPLSDLGHKHDNFAMHYCPNIERALAAEAKVAEQAATIERLTVIVRELVDASVEEFGPSRYNAAINKGRAELSNQENREK